MRGAVPEMDYRRTYRWRGRSICQPGTPSAVSPSGACSAPSFAICSREPLRSSPVGVMRCHTPFRRGRTRP